MGFRLVGFVRNVAIFCLPERLLSGWSRPTVNYSRKSRSIFSELALAIVSALLLFFAPAESRSEAALQRLTFITSSGAHEFRVEIADTPGARSKGLMYRKSLPPDQGMLFAFRREEPIMMWMKNTYIPLDMIFVSSQGVVTKIEADTVPKSEAIISSGDPAYAVIELNAGVASKIGLKPGDEVRHSAFRR